MTGHGLLQLAAVAGLEDDSTAGGAAIALMTALRACVAAAWQRLVTGCPAGGCGFCAWQVRKGCLQHRPAQRCSKCF